MNRILASLAFLFMTAVCRGDGMVLPDVALPVARIPDQRALIQFSNGVERLVIETRFAGAGTNFAWVVPLPAPPVIEEATTGLFPTLQCLFQPRLRHDVTHYFQLFMGILSVGYLLRYVRPGSAIKYLDVLACVGVGAAFYGGFGSFSMFLLSLYIVEQVRLRTSLFMRALTLLLLLLSFLVLSAPTLSRTAGAGAAASPTVSILERKLVGIFDTTTIASRDPAALQAWLKQNGFAAPADRNQAIADYVKDGWVFVAAKIRRDNAALQTNTPHPLSFTFKTGKAVYPMRLTGIDNGPVSVELYVFGLDEAQAPHFQVERCAQPQYPTLPLYRGRGVLYNPFAHSEEILPIAHPLLRQWVDGSPVATKLTATLSPDDMRDDVWISWRPFSPKWPDLYSRQGALIDAANWGSGLVAACLLTAFVFGPGRENRLKRPARFVWLASLSGIALTFIIYSLLPKTEVRIVHSTPRRQTYENLEILDIICSQETNLDDVRARMEPGEWSYYESNYLSGGRFREEDSPDNYQLRQVGGHVESIFYDSIGAPSN